MSVTQEAALIKEPVDVTSDDFRDAAGKFATGVTVITTDRAGKAYGTTVSAVSSLSMDPPMMLICLNSASQTHDMVLKSGKFAVNVLSEDQEDLAFAFARKGDSKFTGVPYHYLEEVPSLDGALTTIACRTVDTIKGGTHTVFLAEVVGIEHNDSRPLMYFRGKFGKLTQV